MVNYPIHKIVYTDINKNRAVVFVSEESAQLALSVLEKELKDIGYSYKNINNMLPVSRMTDYMAPKGQVEFRGKIK